MEKWVILKTLQNKAFKITFQVVYPTSIGSTKVPTTNLHNLRSVKPPPESRWFQGIRIFAKPSIAFKSLILLQRRGRHCHAYLQQFWGVATIECKVI